MRWTSSLLALTCLAALCGCALDAGQPWGQLELDLQARFEPAADRLLAGGLHKTNAEYGLAFESVALELDVAQVRMQAGGGKLSFDPAKPPPGFTLCHIGECHAVDGRILTYAEVEEQLAGGAASAPQVTLALEQTVTLQPAEVGVPTWECSDACRLPRGQLGSLRVGLHRLVVRMRVHDLLPAGQPQRLPKEGVRVLATVPLEGDLVREIAGAVDNGEPVGVRLRARLNLASSLFDGLDFGALPGIAAAPATGYTLTDPAALAGVADRVLRDSELAVTVVRFDP